MKLNSFYCAIAAGLLTAGLTAGAQAQNQEPIRLGFITVKSGALAAGGKQMEDGAPGG